MFQGVQAFLRGIHPFIKCAGQNLSQSETRFNTKISSYHIIVEIVFGTLGLLWGVIGSKWKCAENN